MAGSASTRRPYTVLDVFTDRPLAGNALAVVHDADGLDDETMLSFARETRLSETTFVQTAGAAGADYRNRIFTVAGEVPFAGHPSLGTAVAVARARGEREARYVQQTGAGLQPVEVSVSGDRARASVLQEPARFGDQVEAAPVMAAVGLDAVAADPALPPQIVSTGLATLVAPVLEAAAVSRAAPDFDALDALLAPHDTLNLYLVRCEPADRQARARMFSRLVQEGEDPATGSAAGALAAYLARRADVERLEVTQGVEMGRPSLLADGGGGRPRSGGRRCGGGGGRDGSAALTAAPGVSRGGRGPGVDRGVPVSRDPGPACPPCHGDPRARVPSVSRRSPGPRALRVTAIRGSISRSRPGGRCMAESMPSRTPPPMTVKPPALPPFQTFLDEHRSAVLAFLIATLGPGEADDCFQETFIAALRAYPGLVDGRNLRGWILTIAHRKAIDAARARARRPRPSPELPDAGAPDSGIDGLANGLSETWRAAAALPPRQRAAIAHRFVADLRYREIGQVMGCSEEAARRSVHEGLKKMRRELTA